MMGEWAARLVAHFEKPREDLADGIDIRRAKATHDTARRGK